MHLKGDSAGEQFPEPHLTTGDDNYQKSEGEITLPIGLLMHSLLLLRNLCPPKLCNGKRQYVTALQNI